MMLGLRVLANPDDFMEMSGIIGHNPLCETQPVLGRVSIDYVTYRMEEPYQQIGEAERSKAGTTVRTTNWPWPTAERKAHF
jgi:hypothetical protein